MRRASHLAALGWLVGASVLALLAPLMTAGPGRESGWIASPERVDLRSRFDPPSSEHWFGTDDLGRDVFSRVLHGSRITLGIGLLVGLGSLIVGVTMGSLAGHFGGWVDTVISRLTEAVLAFPVLFLVLAMVAVLGASFSTITLALVVSGWPSEARFVRAEFFRARETGYAMSAVAVGASRTRTIVRHILPNAISPALVSASFGIAGAIMAESALSFLGFGIQPPAASWGGIVGSVTAANVGAWWLLLFPGLAIVLTVLSVHGLADRLSESINPRRRRRRSSPHARTPA